LIPWAEKTELREGTADRYARAIRMHILPTFGPMRLDAISRDDVAAWVEAMRAKATPRGEPLSETTVRSVFAILRVILRDAAAEFGFQDPTHRIRFVGGVGEHRTQRETLTSEQTGQLLAAVAARAPWWLPQVAVLCTTGMRPSELYALTWGDFNTDAAVIRVRASAVLGAVAEPKSARARRRVPIPREVAQLVADSRLPGASDDELVFPSLTGGFRSPSTLLHFLRRVCIEEGLPVVGGRGLRRSFITQASDANLAQSALRHVVGHADERTTRIYQAQQLEAGRAIIGAVADAAGVAEQLREAAAASSSRRR
jgi:integrase